MGLVTGTTSHKLDRIKTYDPSNPYIVGVNGVTALYTNSNGDNVVEYDIDNIQYTTTLIKIVTRTGKDGQEQLTESPRLGNGYKSYVPSKKSGSIFKSDDGHLDKFYPTTFKYTTSAITEDNFYVFKDDVKMGVVFQPKVFEDVFIERQSMTVFESQSRLGKILTLEDLEEYNNGYYKVTKIE